MTIAIERILVFFVSPDGGDWKPVDRDDLPEWIRSQAVIDRMLAGELARRKQDKPKRFFKAVMVDRPRPAGQHKFRVAYARAARGESPGGIILPGAA